jgi:hypothetical protein
MVMHFNRLAFLDNFNDIKFKFQINENVNAINTILTFKKNLTSLNIFFKNTNFDKISMFIKFVTLNDNINSKREKALYG